MLVVVKIVALTAFMVLTLPVIKARELPAVHSDRLRQPHRRHGHVGAAASIFFAYVGFDAVSTAAEETKNPQRNVPIGLIGSLVICTVFYLLVAAGAIGAVGAQPVTSAAGACPGARIARNGRPLRRDRRQRRDRAFGLLQGSAGPRAETIDWPVVGRLVGLAAVIALPSVVLMMMFGQTRVFFTMARDGLLPEKLASVHPTLPDAARGDRRHRRRRDLRGGVAAGRQARGLFELGHAVRLRDGRAGGDGAAGKRSEPPAAVPHAGGVDRRAAGDHRLHRAVSVAAADREAGAAGWGAIGLVVYFLYSRSRSHVGRGLIEVHELDADAPPASVPPMPGAHTSGMKD